MTDYFIVHGWMFRELGLKGNVRTVYAIIFSFSRDGENKFTGSLNYMNRCAGISKSTALRCIDKLIESDLIIREDNGYNKPKYYANLSALDFLPSMVSKRNHDGVKMKPSMVSKRNHDGVKMKPNSISNSKEDKEVVSTTTISDDNGIITEENTTPSSPTPPSSSIDIELMKDLIIKTLEKKVKNARALELLNGVDISIPEARKMFADYFVDKQGRKFTNPRIHTNGLIASFENWCTFAGTDVQVESKADKVKIVRQFAKQYFPLHTMAGDDEFLDMNIGKCIKDVGVDKIEEAFVIAKRNNKYKWDYVLTKARSI